MFWYSHGARRYLFSNSSARACASSNSEGWLLSSLQLLFKLFGQSLLSRLLFDIFVKHTPLSFIILIYFIMVAVEVTVKSVNFMTQYPSDNTDQVLIITCNPLLTGPITCMRAILNDMNQEFMTNHGHFFKAFFRFSNQNLGHLVLWHSPRTPEQCVGVI